MKISIVTISFNQAKYLRQCIESVLTQDYNDVEYIVVDPGSTDGSREIIESYGDRIIRVFEKDKGPADGLNRGFARASGDVLGFINADDYLLTGALTVVAHHFISEGLNHYVSGCGFIERAKGRLTPIQPTLITKFRYLYGQATIFQQGTFFPRTYYNQIGGFNPDNFTSWDGELFLSFAHAKLDHKIIRNELAVFRIHDDSITGTGHISRVYPRDLDRMFREKMGRDRYLLDNVLAFTLKSYKVFIRTLRAYIQ